MRRQELSVGMRVGYESYRGAHIKFGVVTSLNAKKTRFGSLCISVSLDNGTETVLWNARDLMTVDDGEAQNKVLAESAAKYEKANKEMIETGRRLKALGLIPDGVALRLGSYRYTTVSELLDLLDAALKAAEKGTTQND